MSCIVVNLVPTTKILISLSLLFTGNYVGPPRQYGPPPPNINNNNNPKPGNYGGSMRGGPHIHDSYVPVHTRSSSRSNGSAFPTKMIVQSGSKV